MLGTNQSHQGNHAAFENLSDQTRAQDNQAMGGETDRDGELQRLQAQEKKQKTIHGQELERIANLQDLDDSTEFVETADNVTIKQSKQETIAMIANKDSARSEQEKIEEKERFHEDQLMNDIILLELDDQEQEILARKDYSKAKLDQQQSSLASRDDAEKDRGGQGETISSLAAGGLIAQDLFAASIAQQAQARFQAEEAERERKAQIAHDGELKLRLEEQDKFAATISRKADAKRRQSLAEEHDQNTDGDADKAKDMVIQERNAIQKAEIAEQERNFVEKVSRMDASDNGMNQFEEERKKQQEEQLIMLEKAEQERFREKKDEFRGQTGKDIHADTFNASRHAFQIAQKDSIATEAKVEDLKEQQNSIKEKFDEDKARLQMADECKVNAERMSMEQAKQVKNDERKVAVVDNILQKTEHDRFVAEHVAQKKAEMESLVVEKLAQFNSEFNKIEDNRIQAEKALSEKIDKERMAADDLEKHSTMLDRVRSDNKEAKIVSQIVASEEEKLSNEILIEEGALLNAEVDRKEAQYSAVLKNLAKFEAKESLRHDFNELDHIEEERTSEVQRAEKLEEDQIVTKHSNGKNLAIDVGKQERVDADKDSSQSSALEAVPIGKFQEDLENYKRAMTSKKKLDRAVEDKMGDVDGATSKLDEKTEYDLNTNSLNIFESNNVDTKLQANEVASRGELDRSTQISQEVDVPQDETFSVQKELRPVMENYLPETERSLDYTQSGSHLKEAGPEVPPKDDDLISPVQDEPQNNHAPAKRETLQVKDRVASMVSSKENPMTVAEGRKRDRGFCRGRCSIL